jgi:hypothetical protein
MPPPKIRWRFWISRSIVSLATVAARPEGHDKAVATSFIASAWLMPPGLAVNTTLSFAMAAI